MSVGKSNGQTRSEIDTTGRAGRPRARRAPSTPSGRPIRAPSRPARQRPPHRAACPRSGWARPAGRLRRAPSSDGPRPPGRLTPSPPRPNRDDQRSPHAWHPSSRGDARRSSPASRFPAGRSASRQAASLLVSVADDVHHVAVGGADQEPPHPPLLDRQRVDDLVAAALRFDVRLVDIVSDTDRDDGVLRTGRVPRDELDARPIIRRAVVGNPAEVEALGLEPQVVGVEARARSRCRRRAGSRSLPLLSHVLPTPRWWEEPISGPRRGGAGRRTVRGSRRGSDERGGERSMTSDRGPRIA